MSVISMTQARKMLEMQYKMNERVKENHLAAKFPYLRAAVVEGAEGIEHHGWKWWKHQEKDLPQLRMELVDVWHFYLSHLVLTCGGDIEQAAEQVCLDQRAYHITFDGKQYNPREMDTVSKLELVIGLAVSRRTSISLFYELMKDCGMDWPDLIREYATKNTLNFFRQDNGYKEGTYLKIWNGKEDNVHLVEIMAELDSSAENFMEVLYVRLQERYSSIGGE